MRISRVPPYEYYGENDAEEAINSAREIIEFIGRLVNEKIKKP